MATPQGSSTPFSPQTYPLDPSLKLGEAGPMWLEEHKRYIRPRTIQGYEAAIKNLAARLGPDLRLDAVDIGHFRRYQVERSKTANPNLINGELVCLQQILRNAGRWKYISEFYKPLPVPTRGAGHSLSQEEEARLREVAFSRPKWRLAAHCMTIMLSTTMGFGELRQLRRRDVDMQRRSIHVVEGVKNEYRDRIIPMNAAALESMTWILDRWERLGGASEEEYILPHRPRAPKGPWIFDEPMEAIRTAFRSIRQEAGLKRFRIYDCRVQAITKLLSNPKVSPQVSREIAGHISQAMSDRYSIQQFDTKKAALDALEDPSAEPEDPPPAPQQPPVALDPMSAFIQAEVARQVALTLERLKPPALPDSPPSSGPRLVQFPGRGPKHA